MKRRIMSWICCGILLLPIVALSLFSCAQAPVEEDGGSTWIVDYSIASTYYWAWSGLIPVVVEWWETPDGTQESKELTVFCISGSTHDHLYSSVEECTPVKARLLRGYPADDPYYSWNGQDLWETYYDEASETLTLFVPNALGPEDRAIIQAGKISLVFLARVCSVVGEEVEGVPSQNTTYGMYCVAYELGDGQSDPVLGALEVKNGRIVVRESRAQWILYGGLFEAGNIQIRTHLHADEMPSDGVPFFRDGMTVEEFGKYLAYQRSLTDSIRGKDLYLNWDTVRPWASAGTEPGR